MKKNDFRFGITGQYYGTYGKATIGANLRPDVFVLGTDNLLGFVKKNGCPDTENDGIANNEDECPSLPGLPELSGCPDTDHDGMKDTQDKCPDAAGLKDLEGCPLVNFSKVDVTDSLQTALSKALLSSPVLS